MLPDDIRECTNCGVPLNWLDTCRVCDHPRDSLGRFISAEQERQYINERAKQSDVIGWYYRVVVLGEEEE